MRHAFTLLLCVMMLPGCGVYYWNPEESSFYKSISASEKAAIEKDSSIVKDWYGTNEYGDYSKGKLLINKTKGKLYNFTEIGVWKQKRTITNTKMKGWEATVKDSTVHDNYGNIIYREFYIDKNKDDVGSFLWGKLLSTSTDSLRQSFTYYYPNGQAEWVEKVTVINPSEKLTDEKKTKKVISTASYDITGQSIPGEQVAGDIFGWFVWPVSMSNK